MDLKIESTMSGYVFAGRISLHDLVKAFTNNVIACQFDHLLLNGRKPTWINAKIFDSI